jgi:O-antigen ligase
MIFNLTNTDDNIIVAERVSGLTNIEQDESLSNRVRYWTHAFNSIRENPILGVGVGNWRIVSTKYDSQNIYSYVVPYATHNDFLEIFAEIGTLGFISYIAFFFFLFQKNFKNLIKWTNSNITINHLFLLLCLMYFILDSSINFPLSRPLMQMVLILFIVLNELINSNKVSNED